MNVKFTHFDINTSTTRFSQYSLPSVFLPKLCTFFFYFYPTCHVPLTSDHHSNFQCCVDRQCWHVVADVMVSVKGFSDIQLDQQDIYRGLTASSYICADDV